MILKKLFSIAVVCAMLTATAPAALASASSDGRELGDDTAILLDLVLFRPLGLVTTVGGIAAFVVSLPISLPTLSAGKTYNALVIGPARYTFVRPLGDEYVPW